MMPNLKYLQQLVLVILFFSLTVAILYIGAGFWIPLTLAAILAMLLRKLSVTLERWNVHRAVAALLSVFVLLITVSLILTLIGWQLSGFAEHIDLFKKQGEQWLNKISNWVSDSLHIKLEPENLKNSSTEAPKEMGKMAVLLASKTISIFIDGILILVYIFLFLLFRTRIKNFIIMLVKTENRKKAQLIITKSTLVSQHYLEGLAKMIATLWIMYGIGFSLVGVENAIFFAVLCGILEIVPFVGNLLGTAFTVMAVAAQGGNNEAILGVLAVYVTVQFVQTYILEPWIVGNQVRINPLFTIIGLVAGELIWGIAGLVLTIPLLGIIRIVCDHIPQLKPYAYLIGSDPDKKKSIFDRIKNLRKK